MKVLDDDELLNVSGGDIIEFIVETNNSDVKKLRDKKLKKIKNIEKLPLATQLSYRDCFYLVCDNINKILEDKPLTDFRIFFNKKDAERYAAETNTSTKEFKMFHSYGKNDL